MTEPISGEIVQQLKCPVYHELDDDLKILRLQGNEFQVLLITQISRHLRFIAGELKLTNEANK